MRQGIIRWVLALGLLATCGLAGSAAGPEENIRRTVEARFGLKVESVRRAPFLGLYELVLAGDEREIAYTDVAAAFLFSGNVYDLQSRRNLTQDRLDRLSAIRFDELPLDLAIKQVRGNGKRQLAVFSDPFCPYCKQLDQNMAVLDDVTIYTFMYPILRKDESPEMAARIWCSPDRARAYLDLMLRNRPPGPRAQSCTAPVDKWLALGERLRIRATPVSYAGNGMRVVGSRFEEVQRVLEEPARR